MSETHPLSAHVIGEIKSWIGRKDLNRSELARRLGVSHTWVSNRLAGQQEIGLGELERIAQALGVDVKDLLAPAVARSDQRTNIPSPTSPNRPIPEQRRRVRFQHRHVHRSDDRDRVTPVTSRTGASRPVIKPWACEGVVA